MTAFARRLDNVTGSAIRELFKLVADPSIISFGGGNPAMDAARRRRSPDTSS